MSSVAFVSEASKVYAEELCKGFPVARCITEEGEFEPEKFAYEELPLWLQYERGGGKSIKAAARKLIGKRANWLRNFYRQGEITYVRAGANGAAMRNLPVGLANVNNEKRLFEDSFFNSIITHGHPRAILGAILYGLAIRHVITASSNVSLETLVEQLIDGMSQAGKAVAGDERVTRWIAYWEKDKSSEETTFRRAFETARQEAASYLQNMRQLISNPPINYYTYIGALEPKTKGSGLATVCSAIYLFLKYQEEPEEAVEAAVNLFGSDTDTIAAFVGALLGARHGLSIVPDYLHRKVQDKEYLLDTGTRLHAIAAKKPHRQVAEKASLSRTDAYLRILAWEIGLHEMFWDAIDVGGVVFHPTMGRGTIIEKTKKPIRRDDYVAKLISIAFDCGQSCVFHSRVENNNKVSESLAINIEKALE